GSVGGPGRVLPFSPVRRGQAAAHPVLRRALEKRLGRDVRRSARGPLYASGPRRHALVARMSSEAKLAAMGRRIEEAGLNALQTQRQLFYDGWVLRVSPGKAKRGRS